MGDRHHWQLLGPMADKGLALAQDLVRRESRALDDFPSLLNLAQLAVLALERLELLVFRSRQAIALTVLDGLPVDPIAKRGAAASECRRDLGNRLRPRIVIRVRPRARTVVHRARTDGATMDDRIATSLYRTMRTARAHSSVEKRFPGFPLVMACLSSFLISVNPLWFSAPVQYRLRLHRAK